MTLWRTLARVLFLIIVGAGAPVNAGPVAPSDPPAEPAPSGAPDLQEQFILVEAIDPENRGSVPPGQPVWRAFKVTNLSQRPVHLSLVDKTCAFVIEELPAADVAPGASVQVRVGTVSAAVPGTQRHGAVLEAREVGGSGSRPNRASLGFIYTPDVEFTVVPTKLTEHAIAGERYEGHIYVQRPRVASLGVHNLSVTIPGMEVGPARVLPENRGVLDVPFSGVFDEPGLREGFVSFATNSAARPGVSVHVGVRVLPRWRPSLPGIVRVLDADRQRSEHTVRIHPRFADETRRLEVATLEEATAGVAVDLQQDGDGVYQLRIALQPSELPTPTGSAHVRLVDSKGNLALQVPVVWYTPRTPKSVPAE